MRIRRQNNPKTAYVALCAEIEFYKFFIIHCVAYYCCGKCVTLLKNAGGVSFKWVVKNSLHE